MDPTPITLAFSHIHCDEEGDWKIFGRVSVDIDDVAVSCIHKPGGRAETHHIEIFGGTLFGEPWRANHHTVMRWVQDGRRLHVESADGSRAYVEVRKHWTSAVNPSGLYLATRYDGTRHNNLLSLPDCGMSDS